MPGSASRNWVDGGQSGEPVRGTCEDGALTADMGLGQGGLINCTAVEILHQLHAGQQSWSIPDPEQNTSQRHFKKQASFFRGEAKEFRKYFTLNVI